MDGSSWLDVVPGVGAVLLLGGLALYAGLGLRTARSPWPSRWLALATLAAAVLVLWRVVHLVTERGEWSARHALTAALLLATLVAVAYQWPPGWFRAFALAALVGVLALATSVGTTYLGYQAREDARARSSELDVDLAAIDLAADLEAAAAAARAAALPANATPEQIQAVGTALGAVDQRARLSRDGAAQTSGAGMPELSSAVTVPVEGVLGPLRAAMDLTSRAETSRIEAQELIASACDAAGGRLATATDTGRPEGAPSAIALDVCTEQERAEGEDRQPLEPVQRRELARDVAAATLAVACVDKEAGGATADEQSAVVKAAKELAVADAAARDDTPRPQDVIDATRAGGVALVEALGPDDAPWQLQTALWLLLLAGALLFHRMLEIINAGLAPGPVRVDVEDVDDKELGPALRHHLVTNVPEPGAQPGTVAATSITDLIALDPVHGKVAKVVLGVANVLGFPPRGYIVTATSIAPAKPEDDPAKARNRPAGSASAHVTVVLKGARTQRTLEVFAVERDRLDDAVRDAAYQAASSVIARARGVPPWLQWRVDEAATFAGLSAVRRRPGSLRRNHLPELKRFVRQAPGSAQVRVMLGHEYELWGSRPGPVTTVSRHDLAYEQYRVAVQMWPDYLLAQYRVGIAGVNWRDAPEGALDGPGTRSDEVDAQVDGAYRRVVRYTGWLMPLRKLSIRERGQTATWGNWLDRHAAARLARRVSESSPPTQAQDEAPVSPAGPQLSDVSAQTTPGDKALGLASPVWDFYLSRCRSAVTLYNAACAYAVWGKNHDNQAAALDMACTLLRRMVACPDVALVSLEWLRRDPDLEVLREGNPPRLGAVTAVLSPSVE